MRHRFPGSSALRASTPGLKSDDPSGASPLRDRHAVAPGLGSVDRIAQRQGLSLLCFKAKCVTPTPSTLPGVAQNSDLLRERHPSGVGSMGYAVGLPGSSALRASTPGLKSDDPSGASPLRDRHAVAAGLGSVDRIAQRQGLSLLCFKAQCVTPRFRLFATYTYVDKFTTFVRGYSYRKLMRI